MPKAMVGANAIVSRVTAEGKTQILLGKRLGGCIDAGTWGLPAGRIEVGETPLKTVNRECEEETGLKFKGNRIIAVVNGQFHEKEELIPYQSYFIQGACQEGEAKNCEPDKCEGWQWFDITALPSPLFAPLKQFVSQFPDALNHLNDLPDECKPFSLVPHSIFKPLPLCKDIGVVSFDFDRCLYSQSYMDILVKAVHENPSMSWGEFLEVQNKALCRTNQGLFQHITEEAIRYQWKELKLMSGSGRQSFQDDWLNRYTGPVLTGSSFYGLLMIQEQLHYLLSSGTDIKTEVIYLLLADLYARPKLNPGDAYRKALEAMHANFATWLPKQVSMLSENDFVGHPDWVFDDSKLTILYAQIHHLVLTNPKEHIKYHFYDDRLDILDRLEQFLPKYFEAIPIPCLTITLNHYANGEYKRIATIEGKGDADEHYAESIEQLMILAGGSTENHEIINVIDRLTEDKIAEFKAWREAQQSRPINPK